jgi:tetratricopeptide (TPR) repeat protein
MSVKIRIYRHWGLCLVLASSFPVAQECLAQDTGQANRLLLPPKSNLAPVHWPDVTQLEPEVREQLTSQQSALAATVKDPKATDTSLSEAYGAMGETYQAYSLSSPARECYLNASRLAPREFRWIYLLGKLDQQDDRFEDAISSYRIARALRPAYLGVPVNLGNIYLQLNRLSDANDNFKAALAIDQDSAAALYGLGQIALSERRYAEAVKYFERALALIPSANRIHYSLAMAYRGLGDTEKAMAQLAQQGTVGVRVSDPLVDGLQELIRGERVHLARGKLALEARRFVEADNEFRKAIAANRDSIPAHVNLGAVLIQTGDLKSAAEQFEAALRVDPRNTNAHYNLAFLLANEKKHGAAILHLQSVLSIEPHDLGARFFLAQELLKSERRDEALSEFSRIVETDPNNEDALLEQVKLLQQKRQYKQALDSLKKANAQYPEKGQTAVMLAYLLAASPQYDLRDGQRALELAQTIFKATGRSEHGAVVALALAELGRCTEAAEWQRRMIAAAEREHKTDLVAKLSADLKLYAQGQTCRPAGGRSNPN